MSKRYLAFHHLMKEPWATPNGATHKTCYPLQKKGTIPGKKHKNIKKSKNIQKSKKSKKTGKTEKNLKKHEKKKAGVKRERSGRQENHGKP